MWRRCSGQTWTRSSSPLNPPNRRGTDPYARWCGRGGVVRRPPIPIDGGEHGARLEQDGPRDGGPTMRDTALLQLALGLTPPWTVSRADFDPEAHRLDIQIDFAPGSRFACPSCGAAD